MDLNLQVARYCRLNRGHSIETPIFFTNLLIYEINSKFNTKQFEMKTLATLLISLMLLTTQASAEHGRDSLAGAIGGIVAYTILVSNHNQKTHEVHEPKHKNTTYVVQRPKHNSHYKKHVHHNSYFCENSRDNYYYRH